MEADIQAFLTSALAGGEWSVSRPGALPVETVPSIHWIRSLVGPRFGLDAEEKMEILYLAQNQATIVHPIL
jgi:hypothetical protein